MGLTRMLILLYADDAVILSDSRDKLQQGLSILIEYCTKWKITLNTDRTNIVVFRVVGFQLKISGIMTGKKQELMKNCIYLGPVFSSGSLSWKIKKTLVDKRRKLYFHSQSY